MCGIAGLIGFSPDRSESQIVAMLRRIAHRGPDDEGVWREGDVCFGQRRLSIIDVSPAGRQPMVSSSGRWAMTLNGEIYNFADLRRELESERATPWRGHSDSEVFLEMVDRHGVESALAKAKGMFALALWDRENRTAYLARDRMGEKPLCYAAGEKTLAFASELTAMEAAGVVSTNLSMEALRAFLRYGYVPAPLSVLEGVRKLEPGVLLIWRAGALPRSIPYWRLADVIEAGRKHRFEDPQHAGETLEAVLRQAVSRQMVSDVPIGVFLSGGLDSMLVTALMQAQSRTPIRTFTLGFDSPEFNEAEQARAVAKHLGTNHTEHYASMGDAQSIAPRLGALYDEPFADASQIPTVLVSELAQGHVKVCLTGDGGDEMFGGYVRYPGVARLWGVMRRMPGRSLIGRGLEALPVSVSQMLFSWLGPVARRYASRGQLGPSVRRAGRWLRARSVGDLFEETMTFWPGRGPLIAPSEDLMMSWRPNAPSFANDLEPMLWRDTVDYLPGDLLTKVDRAAMSVGLETRAPFLDPDLIDFAWRVPSDMKVRGQVTKWLPRQVLSRFAPQSLIDHPKLGFSPPLNAWLLGALRGWALDLIEPTRLRRQGLLESQMIQTAWSRLEAGDTGQGQPLWAVLMLQSWLAARGV